ncbi:transcriptional regulator [Peptoniphilus sp. HMSC075B08]|uniref:helix-turn-helix domain-containing protein n=1 Tax=Peptoniphilus sp. HMSC075B08 TaxID=1739525 RepID=UPI0008A3DB40|nr:helix-turn-helix transcriptional regulator [Peptoniphilus sp. HMSC075B08]OFO59581.1 transcriptional regulator [Peptoniphilus sp. HMSC075B08]
MYGEKIKTKRRELNLSQEDLANKLFVTRQAISKWENDKATPTMTNLRELSEVFGVDMAYFIGEADGEKKLDNNKEETDEVEEIKEEKLSKKRIIGKGLWDIFIYACLCIIGIFFYSVYYYLFMERLLEKDPSQMPYLILSIYMVIAVIAFPQAYKFVEEKIDGLEYNLFSKVVLPVVYIISPIIVAHYIIKKKN